MFNIWYQQGLNRVEALGVALLEDTALVFVRWLLTASLLLLVLIYFAGVSENFTGSCFVWRVVVSWRVGASVSWRGGAVVGWCEGR